MTNFVAAKVKSCVRASGSHKRLTTSTDQHQDQAQDQNEDDNVSGLSALHMLMIAQGCGVGGSAYLYGCFGRIEICALQKFLLVWAKSLSEAKVEILMLIVGIGGSNKTFCNIINYDNFRSKLLAPKTTPFTYSPYKIRATSSWFSNEALMDPRKQLL